MEGAPMDYMKRACGYVVDLLEPNERDVVKLLAQGMPLADDLTQGS